MGDILSQQEIDALLQALSSGELAAEDVKEKPKENKVKLYDFKNPKKFAQDQLRTLGIIYDNVARSLSTALSTSLRIAINVDVATIEQLAYNEFIRSLPEPTVIGVCSLKPLEGLSIIEVNSRLAFALIDRMLGGDGKNSAHLHRGLTDIEQRLFCTQFFEKVLNITSEAWSNLVSIEPHFEHMEYNPQMAQIVSPNEIIALVTLSASAGEEEGFINIALPYLMLEEVIAKLTTRFWYSNITRMPTEHDRSAVEERLQKTQLSLGAAFRDTTVTLKDVLQLAVGDVIKLDHKIEQEIRISVANRLKFKGLPGSLGKKMAIQITGFLEGEEK